MLWQGRQYILFLLLTADLGMLVACERLRATESEKSMLLQC